MGAMTDVTDEEWTLGISPGFSPVNLPHSYPHYFQGILTGFQLTVME